ncbi:MAG: bifunctional adenosylcobinamide kinase/adenosylcobinamide-phosphate guanylyltransferase [Magnetococcales bacterium]|nr:bifunctional adenosylcobinamide kinase/adenosylcobinamide-phosphate guanylyltransferase [Magnetococcales bacterium]
MHLILGGARSGKSTLATRLAEASGRPVALIVTARADDAEMAIRIQRHRTSRPTTWTVIEEPLALGDSLRRWVGPDRFVVVDCLTLWLTNLLLDADPTRFQQERQALVEALSQVSGALVLVSNETGLGVVPMGPLSRQFVDESGWLHQDLARMADRVTLMVAGLPMPLKGSPS